jgi:inosine-uridine nucleoside N-ribohydrolase
MRAVGLVAAVILAACAHKPAGTTVVYGRTPPPTAIMTTDCGVDMDDQWALTHLVLSPEVDVRAVLTTHASSVRFSSASSAKCVDDVLRTVGLPSGRTIPVVAGSDQPLQPFQGTATPRPSAAVDLLLRISRAFSSSHRLLVLSTGAATEVASAILTDPSLAGRIRVVAMGFEDWPRGGPEFNITNDPAAWRVILDSPVPLVIGSAAVTKGALRLTRRQAAAIMQPHGHLGAFLYSLFDRWLTERSDLVAKIVAPETWVVWDEVVVAYTLGLARGDEVPRPRLQADMVFSHPETPERITWISQIDAERLWSDLTTKIDRTR